MAFPSLAAFADVLRDAGFGVLISTKL